MDIQLVANTIRGLAMDGVQAAKSGHPGMPMGMADVSAVLWLKHLKHNPQHPAWPDRDRFVLSAGHGSMLIYSLLHLAGYDLPLDDLKRFRQWKSLTPGHPEYRLTPGVETTTGPLSQGASNAVGMAIAEAMLAERFNAESAPIVNHHTYVICSDGDLMEGASHEVFALAGHLKLDKLVVLYDDNSITIEGATDLAYSDDVRKRFEGYHWQVLEIDGHDHGEIDRAIEIAKASTDAPTLICCRTRIAKGSPNKEGTAASHGAPLGDDEIRLTKQALGLPQDEKFHVPAAVRQMFAARLEECRAAEEEWTQRMERYRHHHGAMAREWDRWMSGELPADLESLITPFDAGSSMATRQASGTVIQELSAAIPWLVGGSADLAPSNNTNIKGGGDIAAGSFGGRNFHFGVREFGMAGIMNGVALHGGFRIFGGTFLVFADFLRPAIRLASIMHLPVVYVFTHDSIFVGEDGPTHQPVEQLASLRVIPGLTVIRPAEASETAAAWTVAMEHRDGPTALLLTRQNLPTIDRSLYPAASNLAKGAYVLWQSAEGTPDLILMASGSEVSITLEAAEQLAKENHDTTVRVVSFPSWELFERQDKAYRETVLPAACRKRLSVEAGRTMCWERYIGAEGQAIGLDHFGASAPYQKLAEVYGFTTDNVLAQARAMLGNEG